MVMSWIIHRCARCGKKIIQGNEYFIGKSAYGERCYKIMRQKQIEFETQLMKKARRG